jgi:SAM-dependent methyltransferase
MIRAWRTSPTARLFQTSFLIFYLEVALVRLVGAYVPYASFFSNHVVIGALLGVSLGFFLTGRRGQWVRAVPSLLLLTCLAVAAFHLLHRRGMLQLVVGNPASPDSLCFGTSSPTWRTRPLELPLEASLLAIYVAVVLSFACLSQQLGRRFEAQPRRLLAYAVHLLGSIAGIAAFTALSVAGCGPFWWFAPAMFLIAFEIGGGSRALLVLLACQLVIGWLHLPQPGWERTWSPYNRIDYEPAEGLLFANGIGHQRLVDRSRAEIPYGVPYRALRATDTSPRRVLVIGAGTGNDVAVALANGAEHVDAVEIDPSILAIGIERHPDHPFDDPRVTTIQDDGRAFLGRCDESYDMIVFGLVDSLTLQSSYSSLRLENYLFTREGVEAVRAHLAPGGLFVAYNYLRSGWLVVKLEKLFAEVFGAEPIVLSWPARAVIGEDDAPDECMTWIFAGNVEALGSKLAREPMPVGAPAAGEDAVLSPSKVREGAAPSLPSDDWPYPYLRDRAIPVQNLRNLALLALGSLFVCLVLRIRLSVWNERHFFLLGAAFSLVEMGSIARMAALLGTTWQVHAAVVALALACSLLGTALAAWRPELRMRWLYCGLVLALLPSGWIETSSLLVLPRASRAFAGGALLFAPVLFSSAIFAVSFRRTSSPQRALGSNVAGLVAGAALESLAMVSGLRALVGLIAGLYLLSIPRR